MPFKSEERADTKVWRLELAWNGAQGNAVGDGIPEAAGDGTQVLQGLRRHLACDGSHLGVLSGGVTHIVQGFLWMVCKEYRGQRVAQEA